MPHHPSETARREPTGTRSTGSVRCTSRRTVLVAAVGGVLTFPRGRAVAREIERLLTPDIELVVLDLSAAAPGLDAPLLAGLMSLRTTLRRRAGRLTIVATGERLARLVRVSALDDLLTIVPSLEAAFGVPDDAESAPDSRAQTEEAAA